MQEWVRVKWFTSQDLEVNNFDYASVPLLIGNNEDKLIITKRSAKGKSHPFLYKFYKETLSINLLSESPIIAPGQLGEFDEDGVMPVCSIAVDDKIYLYYIGWNVAVSTPFRNAVGLAISEDGGNSFYKPFRGPILDRSIYDPCFVASCSVMRDKNLFKIWYLSCDNWEMQGGKLSHKYNIKYGTSTDGINWKREGRIAIDYFYENEYAISVPRVICENNLFKMWYSFRGNGEVSTYRIGYAESLDGVSWIRKDKEISFDISVDGGDSEMLCYPYIFDHLGSRFMLYNGNGYGKTGFGIAKLLNR